MSQENRDSEISKEDVLEWIKTLKTSFKLELKQAMEGDIDQLNK